MDHELSLEAIKKEYHGTLTGYLVGLVSSLILTCSSFYLVWARIVSGKALVCTLVALAVAQAAIQLRYFMHLGKEEKPRWMSISFFFMLVCVIIIVFGSIWIMYDLNMRVMDGMSM